MTAQEGALASLAAESMREHNQGTLAWFCLCIFNCLLNRFAHTWHYFVSVLGRRIKIFALIGFSGRVPHINR
jgi:hypothetical protein